MSDAGQPESGDRPPLKLVQADDVRPILRDTLTDLGNAQRLVQRHGRNIRCVHHWKKWLTWDGIAVEVADHRTARRLRRKLYGIRDKARKVGDHSLDGLSILILARIIHDPA